MTLTTNTPGTRAPYTADTWPVAAAMLAFGGTDSHGGPIQDADPEEWAKQLRLVARMGFTEVDPTDTWVRVGDLDRARLADFSGALSDAGLTIPAISTSRRSVPGPPRSKTADTSTSAHVVRFHDRVTRVCLTRHRLVW